MGLVSLCSAAGVTCSEDTQRAQNGWTNEQAQVSIFPLSLINLHTTATPTLVFSRLDVMRLSWLFTVFIYFHSSILVGPTKACRDSAGPNVSPPHTLMLQPEAMVHRVRDRSNDTHTHIDSLVASN